MPELLKRRYRVMLDFDLIVNDSAIIESGNADEVKQWDLALLHQFIKDKQHVQYLATEYIALNMGSLTIDDYEKKLGIGDKHRREVFTPAIDALPPDIREQWEAVKDDEEFEWTLEGITDCFDTELINAHIEEVKEEQEIITEDIDRPLTFDELVTALDVISVPVEVDSIPMPYDPDDFSVV